MRSIFKYSLSNLDTIAVGMTFAWITDDSVGGILDNKKIKNKLKTNEKI